MEQESETVVNFKKWLQEYGHGFHPDVKLVLAKPEGHGLSVFTSQFLPPDTRLVSCPSSLAITKDLAEKALFELFGLADIAFQGWNERQFQVTYIALHSIVTPTPKQLKHNPYLSILPLVTTFNTALYFSEAELESFKGSNLYGATLDRRSQWQEEWKACFATLASVNQEWAEKFTWDLYLQSCTQITSRAFPSSLLSDGPEATYPVLIPGLDSFNHARDQEVSWIAATEDDPSVCLIQHKVGVAGQELFIDYGPKPNSELILGYGFALPDNPDDTILLKVGGGGTAGTTWQVGRDAAGADGLFEEILHFVSEEYPEGDISYEDHLEAAGALSTMVQASLDRLPDDTIENDSAVIRPSVFLMRQNYIQGQRDILRDLLEFAKERETETIEAAQAEGIELVFEEDD